MVRCDEPAQPTMSAPDDDDETSQPWHPDAAAAIATKARVEASGVGVGRWRSVSSDGGDAGVTGADGGALVECAEVDVDELPK